MTTTSRARALLAWGLVLGLIGAGLTSSASSPAFASSPDPGCGDELVVQHLANGSSWRLCVRIAPYAGLVLEDVEFRPATGDREYAGYKRILDSLSLAQLNVTYDNGAEVYNDITDYGFGGDHLLSQTADTCTGKTRAVTNLTTSTSPPSPRTVAGICLDEVPTGLDYESREWSVDGGPRYAAQGSALQISSLSKVSWYEYQQKITLDDQGGIDVGLGATGDVAPGNAPGVFFSTDPTTGWRLGPTVDGQELYATSHWHNAIYRVDFGIDEGQRQEVEQWDYTPGGSAAVPTLNGAATERDSAFVADPTGDHSRLSWWRVLNPDSLNRDGHPRSYQIVNDNVLDVDQPLTSWPVAFTNADPCELYASGNLDPGCPNEDVLDYVAGDHAELTDPVAWVNVDFHHVDRDEDQSPMHTHWQYFQLVPRDFFAQGAATPDARSCINGLGLIDSGVRPCIATNVKPPKVSASTSPVTVGTTLSATAGTWNEARTTWTYGYLWFRDDVPITGTDANGDPTAATDPTYRVTPTDVGHAITVKVTASHPGYVSGTATAAAVAVPAGASTTSVADVTAAYGTAALVTVAVTGGGAAATGAVTLSGAGEIQAAQLSGGSATFAVRTLAAGTHTLTASYAGNGTLTASSAQATVTVTRSTAAVPMVRVAKRPTASKKGKAVVTVAYAAGLAVPTGTVTLTLKRGQWTRAVVVTLRAGTARVQLPKLAKRGRWKLTATYSGDTNYAPGFSQRSS
jgi:primary-amine oxidase